MSTHFGRLCSGRIGSLFWPACLLSLLAGVVSRAQEPLPPRCLAQQLEIRVWTEPESAPESDAHLIAIEIQNRDQATCWLDWLNLKFTPDDSARSGNFWGGDNSSAAVSFKEKSQQLLAGEVVHFVLAWSSIPRKVEGMAMNDCAESDGAAFSWASFGGGKPVLELRHLAMQSCGQFFRSAYRLGSFSPGEPVAKEWLERFGFTQSSFARRGVREEATNGAGDSSLSLYALNEVQYLKASFESGYSGYFELFLKSPSPAIANCPFEALRKREADGQTLVYLNHCHNRNPESVTASKKDTRLIIRELGLLPERSGRVEYEVVGEVRGDGKPALTLARTELSIRDPTQPTLPEIDSDLPNCETPDVKLTATVELGAHWRQPRTYPPTGEVWHDAKVFEVMNASGRTCLLGGVPTLKFLNPPEVTSGFLLPAVCRNCGTPLYKPRDSEWIDLKPNESAHFIVDRGLFDSDYWFMCTVVGGLELRLSGEAPPIPLPYEGGSCVMPSVSAWRAGRYDADPLNVQYKRRENRQQAEPALAETVPKECAATASADTGQPTMLPSRGSVNWGLSTKDATYGDPVSVLLWLYNPTDKPQSVWTCMDIDWFWLGGIDVFDGSGHRVLTRAEVKQKERSPAGGTMLSACAFVCTRNFPIEIAPHSCAHTTFSKPAYDFARDLATYYLLPPGHYFLVRAERDQDCRPLFKMLPHSTIGLPLTIREP